MAAAQSRYQHLLCTDAAFGQVIAHMMPDLPNVGWERDLESFAEFFENPAFRSDGLKVRWWRVAWRICVSCL